MAAQPKTVHALKPADQLAEAPSVVTSIPSNNQQAQHHALRADLEAGRRRLSVSERLAEGRGFWRGVFIGVSIGAVSGFGGSMAMMNFWAPQVMSVAQQAWAASSVMTAAAAQDGNALTVRPQGGVAKPDPSAP